MNAEDLGMGDDAYTKSDGNSEQICYQRPENQYLYEHSPVLLQYTAHVAEFLQHQHGCGSGGWRSRQKLNSFYCPNQIRKRYAHQTMVEVTGASPNHRVRRRAASDPVRSLNRLPEPEDPFIRLSAIPELPMTGPTEADSTSERDLDNASPLTLGLCEQFPCHYCIFVYSRPSDVDGDTFPFRRNELIAQINDAPHDEARRRILDSPEYRDAIRDRRVIYIEINTSCRIRLGELEGRKSLKKGLPRRRLTIAGPTFSHICVAVQLLEHMFPRLMQYALYPYRLPPPASANYTSKEKLTVNYNDYVTRQPAWLGLVPDIDEHSSWRKFFGPMQPKEI